MSIFGDIDVTDIPDDPFYSAPNTYLATCTEAKVVEKDGNTSFVIAWTIDEPDSDYHGNTHTEYYSLYPGRPYSDLDAKEKKNLSYLKRRLRNAFDLSEQEIAEVNPSQLVGLEAFITLVANPGKGENEGRTFINVREAKSRRLHEEQNGSQNSGSIVGL